ncbi:protein tyrosine kinase [Mycobacterium sp. Root135]|uniref:polysaccharide biosynthesis tyrosine autokinase n=1 Tax=Mycobacterium sp. Root135 TaxID=1736457 RepID=UPI0006FD4E64|nr:polysaccharide biosynthesis tyrosine autokinase [Mycobacterium sp. Root135]KQY07885.1 protein tyrosine kinase [Mycobacterium sp. Root135]
MTVQDFAQILRTRWVVIIGTIVIAVLAAVGYSQLVPKQYVASTRLFVSTTSDGTNTQTNDGGLFAQRRVLSYTQLLTSEILAQRTVDKLGLDMSAAELQHEITATAPTDTVLIDVTVRDTSAARARDIANTLSDEFVIMAAGLETPDLGARPNARVVVQQRANIPDTPVAPKTLQLVAIAAVAGALIGLLIAIVRYLLDDRIRNSEALEKATGVGEIGNIPADGQRQEGPLIAFGGDRPTLADAFRELRVNLQVLQVADGPRVLLVASPMPREGRSTTAVNLALALAETGGDVVVVDGDLRRPQLASCLGVDGQVGLSTVLTGAATVDEALQETRFPRVSVMASGVVPANPTELLGSQAAKELLRELGGRFAYVVVDSPSLLAKDAALLAGNAHGVVVVARFGHTTAKQLVPAITALTRAGAPLLGSVMTMTPAPKRRSADSYYAKTAPAPGAPSDPPAAHGRHSGPEK